MRLCEYIFVLLHNIRTELIYQLIKRLNFKLFLGDGFARPGGGLYFIPKMAREPNPKKNLSRKETH